MGEFGDSLPLSFLQHMGELLDEQLEAFLNSLSEPSRRGIRLNPLKLGCNDSQFADDKIPQYALLENIGPLTPVPWCREGYLYPNEVRPAKNIMYSAGLFYVQEPSAMCPAAVLNPQPGQLVLDICAAPGGKSVQLAGLLQGQGLLVSNDASFSRCKPLAINLELAGVTNAVVIAEMPARLAKRFSEYFDCILIDAPCSGEGMFRRDPAAIRAYAANGPDVCIPQQLDILHNAALMLKPGGRMVYSTCTFNLLENEGVIAEFLHTHPGFELLTIDHEGLGLSPGLNTNFSQHKLTRTARIWPHISPGDGHFIALIGKAGSSCGNNTTSEYEDHTKDPGRGSIKPPEAFIEFYNSHISDMFNFTTGIFHQHENSLFYQPVNLDLKGLRVVRNGWHIGEIAKGRFTPSHALAMGITKNQARHAINLPEADAKRYLKGESIQAPVNCTSMPGKPWVLICHNSYPLGWARLVNGRLKNQLPPSSLRV